MNARKALQLMEKYIQCGNCGSEYIGNGEGTLDVMAHTFKRTCKCGWNIEVNENDEKV